MTADLNDFVVGGASPLRRALSGTQDKPRLVEWPEGSRSRLASIPLALKLLDNDTRARATAEALRWLTSPLPGGAGLPEEYVYSDEGRAELGLETKLQILAAALVEPATSNRAARDANDLRQLLDADEVAYLFERYLELQQERSPFTSAESWEKVEALVTSLGKGTTPPSSLSGYDSTSLRLIALSLVRRLRTQTRDSSSPTSHSPELTEP